MQLLIFFLFFLRSAAFGFPKAGTHGWKMSLFYSQVALEDTGAAPAARFLQTFSLIICCCRATRSDWSLSSPSVSPVPAPPRGSDAAFLPEFSTGKRFPACFSSNPLSLPANVSSCGPRLSNGGASVFFPFVSIGVPVWGWVTWPDKCEHLGLCGTRLQYFSGGERDGRCCLRSRPGQTQRAAVTTSLSPETFRYIFVRRGSRAPTTSFHFETSLHRNAAWKQQCLFASERSSWSAAIFSSCFFCFSHL